MTASPRILAFAGSLRAGSFNRRILDCAARGAAEAGAEVTVLELREHPLPLFDADLEAEGIPANAALVKAAMVAADGFLIASPEYNSSITAALKNAIDWASRAAEGEAPLEAFRGKVAGLCSASPGGLGGLRGLVHLRAILGSLGMFVLPDQVAVPGIHKLFGEDGSLQDDRSRDKLEGLGRALTDATARLRNVQKVPGTS